MKVLYVVNNYMLGAKVKSTQVDKIVSQNRIDKSHVKIIYDFNNMKQKECCDKILDKLQFLYYNGNGGHLYVVLKTTSCSNVNFAF